MPLLKKKSFEKSRVPEFLRDEEEVFYCSMTNEIFRDYDEFCQRIILCNSMVWSCSMTGKSNLTYAEALESEETAKRNLKDFPTELRIPVLFLASKTKRTGFGDMAEDVFMFMKDRYFVGENVEATFLANKWRDSHILQVIAPTEEAAKSYAKKNGNNQEKFSPPAVLYKYEVEQYDVDDEDITQTMMADYMQLRRKKGLYSRERNKLFLKQYVEINDQGVWVIKESAMEDFGIHRIKFDQIFDGPLPDFDVGKKVMKAINGKKPRQETLAKYLTKNGLVNDKKATKNDLLEKMRQREEEFKQRKELLKQKRAEEKLAEKQKRREENVKISMYLRDWYKPKEDLELEDQKRLPTFLPVESKIGDKYFGDVLMVMQFASTYSKILKTNKFFPGGLTLELMERALTENEVAGPLIDIVQMLLTALFNCQDEEASQYKTVVENSSGTVKAENYVDQLSLTKASHLATSASKYAEKHQGCPLGRLPMYPLTVTELLRLHLLSSGARINEMGARWRYQERGGYTSEDDPGLHFRIHQPHIVKALAVQNVVQLSVGDKLKVVSCLINQLLTYADVRDAVEERLEKSKQAKVDMRTLQVAERKREQEYLTTKLKLKRENKGDPKLEQEMENLKKSSERKKLENERKLEKLNKTSNESQTLLGQDRAFRKYLKIDTIPGLFVDSEEDNPGVCLDELVVQNSKLIGADRTEILLHIRKIHEEFNTSDKENEPRPKLNGTAHPTATPTAAECSDLLMCSADGDSCAVHSARTRARWCFVRDERQLGELVQALNKRGARESELRQVLEGDREALEDLMLRTPVTQLNSNVKVEETAEQRSLKLKRTGKSKYDDANLGYPVEMETSDVLQFTFVDYVLEMEEKLHAGNLGTLKIKDRDAWRECLNKRRFDELDRTLVKHENGKYMKVKKEEKSSRSNTPEIQIEPTDDPGKYLGQKLDEEMDTSCNGDAEITIEQSEEEQNAIRCLSIALAQVAYSVELKYLKKPLGHGDLKKDDMKKKENFDIIDRWEQSLLTSSSYSQLFMHYCTLDTCIMWSRSALLARCRTCRRQKDSENMLLCDECNHGYHMYCLKPKLKAVPEGKWFCDRCLKQMELELEKQKPEPPKKRRRLFRDEEEEDETEEDTEDEEIESNGVEEPDEEEVEEEEESEPVPVPEPAPIEEPESEQEEEEEQVEENGIVEVCEVCKSGGELLCCDGCPGLYHLECVVPPLRNVPRGDWYCHACKATKDSRRKRDQRYADRQVASQRDAIIDTRRQCAARAQLKIHGFVKSLRRMSETEDSDSEEVVVQRRSRREDGRIDLPLHNAALHELLSDVMRHQDAWPFIRPVQKQEVPDYYDVITKPMDFGTIKYKLNMGEYKKDSDFMADVVLVFENCNTYNNSEADVYRCGVTLQKHLLKKCKELGLKLPSELQDSDDDEDEEEELELPRSRRRK